MIKKQMLQILLFGVISLVTVTSSAFTNWDRAPYPFYIGGTVGYGETTWSQLVPNKPNLAMSISTPVSASDGGLVWGVYGGYEFIRSFALEGSYMRYPTAKVRFDPVSLFTFYHNGRTGFSTRTESISLVAKVMLPLGCSKFRLYSDFGAAGVHRDDVAANRWRLSPQFGAGFNYDLTQRVMLEFGTEYVAGYGQSELDPAKHYIPFLYSGFLRMAYRV